MKAVIFLCVAVCYIQSIIGISNTQLDVREENLCGGDVLLAFGNDTFIQYKLGVPYATERCEWFLKAPDKNKLYTVSLRVLAHGFNRDTGIALYSIDPWRSNLSSYHITDGDDYEIILYDFTMLKFEAYSVYAGTGFQVSLQLRIREEQYPILPSTSTHLLTTWSDYFKHPVNDVSYLPSERVYVVISPPNPTYYQQIRLYLDFLDIQWCGDICGCDWLEVYRLHEMNEYHLITRLCGIGPNVTEHIISQTNEPYLLVFHSDNATTAGGFQVTWCQSQ